VRACSPYHDAAKETMVLFRKNILKKRFLEKGLFKRGALAFEEVCHVRQGF